MELRQPNIWPPQPCEATLPKLSWVRITMDVSEGLS